MDRTITATQSVHAAQERCQTVLLDDPGTLLGDAPTAEDRRFRRFRTALLVDIGSGGSIRQEVEVHVDAPRPDAQDDTVVLPLRVHATGRATLFPSFTGELTACAARQGSQLTLRGNYTVPLGVIGRYGDKLVGHRAAQRSLTSFLSQIATRLETEVVHRIDTSLYHPAAKPESLHDRHPAPSPASNPPPFRRSSR